LKEISMTKVWMITGSSRGLGRALAEAVLAGGDQLAATARDPAQLRDLVDKYGDSVRAIALDVTDPAAASRAVAETVAAFGRLDVVVNNAGYANVNSIEDFPEDDFRRQVETNLFGVINVTRAALPQLRRQRSGHIIQVSSIGGRITSAGLGPYQTSKWAVGGFSGVLAQEVKHLGIKVTVVEPGGMATDWAGASMRIDQITEDYKPSVGFTAERMVGESGSARGNPQKISEAIRTIANADNPPLKLLIGSDAVLIAKAVSAGQAHEDAEWAWLGNSTDNDGAVPFGETEIGKHLLGQ
jgi:NAD(P)-dependent dehydrogenase (short-subunit alcohol dehydrogenase family)